MNPMRKTMAAALLAACCATAFGAGQAGSPQQDEGLARGPRPGFDDRGQGSHGAHGPGFGHGLGHFGGLHLSEAQQDRLFAIENAAAPRRREHQKAVRRAHESLRALVDAPQFDEARAGAAARELGQAVAAEALLATRLHAQALAVLTPEQREQLRQRRPQPPREGR
jgi:Spy/CpxP family protein refolding chaperone